MEIREATESDIPEILEVLKLSLGESSSQKTKDVWIYKHVKNPFGKSLILLALENNEIIGIRAFMRWKWQLGNKDFSAFRAVDTATHPEHQGKGVFKKLTLHAIEIAKIENGHFIFNTPNTQSLPGYLKMGWNKVDKLRIQIKPSNPFNWIALPREVLNYETKSTNSLMELDDLVSKYNKLKSQENKLFTLKSTDYLVWRYENNSLQKYQIESDKDFFLAGYIKKHKLFKELRIAEHIYCNDIGLQKINKAINLLSKKLGAHVITSSEIKSSIGFCGNYGPILTLRNVNLDSVLTQELLDLNYWSYSLGDLELF